MQGVDVTPGSAFGSLMANRQPAKNTVCKRMCVLISCFVAKGVLRSVCTVFSANVCVCVCVTCKSTVKKS